MLWSVAMGRVFPVVETPMPGGPIYGKGCKAGYDSHYVVATRSGLDQMDGRPCKVSGLCSVMNSSSGGCRNGINDGVSHVLISLLVSR